MMNILKRTWSVLLLSLLLTASIISCKSKVSDADIKAKVETVTTAHQNVVVSVNAGVVTLSGTVATEEDRQMLADAAKNADPKNIKSVINELTVTSSPLPVNTDDADLATKVIDATKDYPTVQAQVNDGVITVTGTLEQARVQPLKMALDALNPKRVDLSELTIK